MNPAQIDATRIRNAVDGDRAPVVANPHPGVPQPGRPVASPNFAPADRGALPTLEEIARTGYTNPERTLAQIKFDRGLGPDPNAGQPAHPAPMPRPVPGGPTLEELRGPVRDRGVAGAAEPVQAPPPAPPVTPGEAQAGRLEHALQADVDAQRTSDRIHVAEDARDMVAKQATVEHRSSGKGRK